MKNNFFTSSYCYLLLASLFGFSGVKNEIRGEHLTAGLCGVTVLLNCFMGTRKALTEAVEDTYIIEKLPKLDLTSSGERRAETVQNPQVS